MMFLLDTFQVLRVLLVTRIADLVHIAQFYCDEAKRLGPSFLSRPCNILLRLLGSIRECLEAVKAQLSIPNIFRRSLPSSSNCEGYGPPTPPTQRAVEERRPTGADSSLQWLQEPWYKTWNWRDYSPGVL